MSIFWRFSIKSFVHERVARVNRSTKQANRGKVPNRTLSCMFRLGQKGVSKILQILLEVYFSKELSVFSKKKQIFGQSQK